MTTTMPTDKTEEWDMSPDSPRIEQTPDGKFQAVKKEKKIPLVELFGPTVQGEGHVIGVHTFFLRFGLCDYKCTMCDSMHAVDPHQVKANATYYTQEQIFHKLQEFAVNSPVRWITYSGGNPCIHDLQDLTLALKNVGWKIAVETQGTFAPNWLQDVDVLTISPKGPGMGEVFEEEKFKAIIKKFRRHPGLNIKCVVFDQRDIEFARMVYEIMDDGFSWIYDTARPPFYLSQGNPFPPGTTNAGLSGLIEHTDILRKNYLILLEDIMQDPILSQARFLPQFHVWLWGNRQGV